MKPICPSGIWLVLLISLAGCYQRSSVDPSTLVHDPLKTRFIQKPVISDTQTAELVRQIESRYNPNGGEASEEQVIQALQQLENWPLGRKKGDQCFPKIESVVSLFQDSSEDLRFHAVHAAGLLGCFEIEKDLTEVKQNDPSPVVRETAAQALIRLGLGPDAWGE